MLVGNPRFLLAQSGQAAGGVSLRQATAAEEARLRSCRWPALAAVPCARKVMKYIKMNEVCITPTSLCRRLASGGKLVLFSMQFSRQRSANLFSNMDALGQDAKRIFGYQPILRLLSKELSTVCHHLGSRAIFTTMITSRIIIYLGH